MWEQFYKPEFKKKKGLTSIAQNLKAKKKKWNILTT